MFVFASSSRPLNTTPRVITAHKERERKMMLKCKNPLMKDKKECVIFWTEFDRYKQSIESMEYSIDNLKFDVFIDDTEFFDIDDGIMYDV